MFGLSKIQKRLERIESDKTSILFCDKCGVAVKKEKAQEVTEVIKGDVFEVDYVDIKHYCDRHVKPYDTVEVRRTGISYYKTFEVDKKGKIIK